MVEDIAEDRKQIAEIKEAMSPQKSTPVVAEADSSPDTDDNEQSPCNLRKVCPGLCDACPPTLTMPVFGYVYIIPPFIRCLCLAGLACFPLHPLCFSV